MANTKKVTKRDYFNAIRAYVEGVEAVGEYSADEVLEFIDKELALLDGKAAKAKERAAAKKAEGDALRGEVEAALVADWQTADEITAAVQAVEGYGDVTRAKVIARLTQLEKAGAAQKATAKVGDVKRVVYRIPQEDAADAE